MPSQLHIRRLAITIMVFCLGAVFGQSFAYAAPDPARAAAEQRLKYIREQHPDPFSFGFTSVEEIQQAKVEKALPVWWLSPQKLGSSPSINDALRQSNMVEFLVVSNNGAVARFLVAPQGDSLEVVRAGDTGHNLESALLLFPDAARPEVKLVDMVGIEFLYLQLKQQ